MNGAIYISNTRNSKVVGSKPVDATYCSINASCPNTCELKGGNGCYAELSFVGIQSIRLNKEAVKLSALQVARAEAKAIDNSYDGGNVPHERSMRLHVAGDSRTITGTRIINAAIGRWKKRGGGVCWSYTHAWRSVSRNEWSNVSILASVKSIVEVTEARKQGYAPAIIVSEFSGDKAFQISGSDIKWIPCPAQTREIGCTDCKLCFNADRLYQNNFGIAFAAHGPKKTHIKKHLTVIK